MRSFLSVASRSRDSVFANRAIELYQSEGYECQHTFDAAVWKRNSIG